MTHLLQIHPRHPEEDLIARAARVLQNNGVIGYPTETVYGIGSNIYSSEAVRRIYRLKQRDQSKALIVIAADVLQISDLVSDLPEAAERLMENFWPGPLTLIFNASAEFQHSAFRKAKTVAIRIPDSPLCLSLIKTCGFPIVSTSANISGQEPATTAQEVVSAFGQQLDLIIDGGPSPSRVPSTVVDVTRSPVRIVRDGAISRLEIDTVLETI
jgi:L-threonylcarbamoyladenylate synthase